MRDLARLTILCALLLARPALAGTTVEDTTGANLRLFDPVTGKLTAVIQAKTIEHDGKTTGAMRATGVYIEHHKDGAKHIITSDHGLMNPNERKGKLTGNVVIRMDDAQHTKIETESLQWDRKKNLATTDAAVTITRDDMTITGVGLEALLGDEPKEPPTKNGDPPKPPAKPAPAEAAPAEPTGAGDRITVLARVKVIVKGGGESPLSAGQPKPEPKAPPRAPAAGEKPKAKPEKPAEPILVTSVGPLVVYRGQMIAIFHDDVRAVQGSNSLQCDKLTLRFDRVAAKDPKTGVVKKKMQVVQLDAAGNVRVDDGKTVGSGDALAWKQGDPATRLTGSPARVTWDNGQKLSADVIRRRTADGQVFCENTPDSGGGPVHFTFPIRDDSGDEKPDAEKK